MGNIHAVADEIEESKSKCYGTLHIENVKLSKPGKVCLKIEEEHPTVTTLGAVRCKVKEIPPEISRLKNLETILLEGNKISSVPKDLALLDNLTELDLAGNRLTHFPNYLLQMK